MHTWHDYWYCYSWLLRRILLRFPRFGNWTYHSTCSLDHWNALYGYFCHWYDCGYLGHIFCYHYQLSALKDLHLLCPSHGYHDWYCYNPCCYASVLYGQENRQILFGRGYSQLCLVLLSCFNPSSLFHVVH